jgi:hypothetical protein
LRAEDNEPFTEFTPGISVRFIGSTNVQRSISGNPVIEKPLVAAKRQFALAEVS